MTSTGYVVLINVMIATAGAMVIAPLLFYLYRIWATRRDKLFSYLCTKSRSGRTNTGEQHDAADCVEIWIVD